MGEKSPGESTENYKSVSFGVMVNGNPPILI